MTAQLSRERLEEIAALPLKTTSWGLQHAPGAYSTVYSHEIVEMARMLLAGMDSEPVAVPDGAINKQVFKDTFDRIVDERDSDIEIGQLGCSNYDALVDAAYDAACRAAMLKGES